MAFGTGAVVDGACGPGFGSPAFIIFLILILLVFGVGFCGGCI